MRRVRDRTMAAPSRIDFRIDQPLRERIEAFGKTIKSDNLSASIRMLIAVGLDRVESADVAYKAQAYREGVRIGISKIRQKIGGMLSEIDSELETENGEAQT